MKCACGRLKYDVSLLTTLCIYSSVLCLSGYCASVTCGSKNCFFHYFRFLCIYSYIRIGNMMALAKIVELIAVGVIFFFGVICNCIVIRSISLSRNMRTAILYNIKNDCTNLLVMNLAITDLLILLVSIPMDVVPEHLSWPYGTFVCKFFSPIQDVCLTASTLTFSAIAVERYLISKGVSHQGMRHAKLVRDLNLPGVPKRKCSGLIHNNFYILVKLLN